MGWQHEPFDIPADIKSEWDAKEAGSKHNSEWDELMNEYSKMHPELSNELERLISNELPSDFEKLYQEFLEGLVAGDKKDLATRKASEICLNFFCQSRSFIGM